jgi:AraC family transcriptional regulator
MALQFLYNPSSKALPKCSAIVNGINTIREYRVENYRTTLSLKSVTEGHSLYRTRQGMYRVDDSVFLLLNEGQEYFMQIKPGFRTQTLCPFFQPGLVSHVARVRQLPHASQLDQPEPLGGHYEVRERLYVKDGRIAACLHALEESAKAPAAWLEDQFFRLADALVELTAEEARRESAFPGARPATRAEMYRRLHRARDYLESCYDQPLTVAGIARVASLSPFHFQRLFREAFGRTPMQYLQARRLAVAQRLLAATDRPVTDICFDVGFESLGAFSWLFRRRLGLSPKEFRSNSAGLKKSRAAPLSILD